MLIMRIKRVLERVIQNEILNNDKIVLLFGARQTGKTTLSMDVLEKLKGKILMINADEIRYHDVLSSRDYNKMKLLLEGYDILFIDEAQRIQDIGINLKIIKENNPRIKMLITGSSSFEIAKHVKEPLTGRTTTHCLHPISLPELKATTNAFEIQHRIEEYLLFGSYPETTQYQNRVEKEKYLRELASSYLYKDVLELANIRNPSKITSLLKLLAFQVGSEVSLLELSKNLALSQETVNSYIDILEKAFIIFRLSGFSKNLRKEVSKRDKIYFWDLGVRNTLINNFSEIDYRNDLGGMWENLLISERLKHLNYNGKYHSSYFWRTYTGAEIDYIEEAHGQLFAYELKYKKARKKAPKTWHDNYGHNFQSITIDNFWDFIS